mmetsp:Transcript_139152/g.388219  ORF Transcript_139152/g.388219 Transcript_139152/m.388219 type:complete len:250 (-) Transcript_139152:155-904(-)
MTSPCEGPFRMPNASRTPRVYAINTLATSESAGTGRVPKYTKFAPLQGRLSYTQTMTVLCTPSRETWSTTYSLPRKYSCTRTAAPTLPIMRCAPMSERKWASASSRLWHSLTPSEPADSTGFTTTGMASAVAKASTWDQLVPAASRTARRPEAWTQRCCTLLLRLFVPVPFVLSPISSDKASASVTPVSQPTMQASTSKPSAAARTASAVLAMLDCSSTCEWQCKPSALAGTCVRISGVSSADHTAKTA